MSPSPNDHVVIIGAGFGGLACAKALGERGVSLTVVDCNNYHLFVPLLYQVATAELSPADIAEPIRRVLRRHKKTEVVMGEVLGVDVHERRVLLADGSYIAYDRLVIATGSAYNYFGHDEWPEKAPGLKTLSDALRLRSQLLRAFEAAEQAADPQERAAWLTFALVGGGPTGVEMAGAIAELARQSLARDFRHIGPREVRVILIEAGERILAGFPPALSEYARKRLERRGVEVLLNAPVEAIEENGVGLSDHFIPARTIIWGAGVRASSAAKWLGLATDRQGRIPVAADLSVEGVERVYAIGDTARCEDEQGKPLPALAQVAKQQGQHLGKALVRLVKTGRPLPSFRFHDRGNAAVIGRNAAIVDFGRFHVKGVVGWLTWAVVHIYMLVGFQNRVAVSVQWFWWYLTLHRNARLITETPRGSVQSTDSPHEQTGARQEDVGMR